MPIKLTADSFLNLLRHSGLIEVNRLNALLNDLKDADVDLGNAREIASFLVARQVLTRWQADKLLQGKRGFFLGKYRLKSLLGRGGMSSVYLAEHVLMRRPCAIKVLPTKRVGDSSYLARFHREAQAVAALDHPNIVRAYDVDHQKERNADIHFLVMEYVDGQSLQDLVTKQGPLGYFEAANYIRQAAAGLEHAHQAGLVHRDVKPGNLLVDKLGIVKILDLGLARFFDEGNEASLTLSNDERVLGTADYLAPEQALDSHGVDHRADIYSLGCTMYFLLTGHPPFTEGTLAQRLMCHQTRTPPSIRSERPDAPPSLVTIVERMMAKRAGQRFQTADEVRTALEDWLLANADDDWIQRHPGVMGTGSGDAWERRSESSVIMSLDDTSAEVPLQVTPPSSFPCIEDPDLAAFLSSLDGPSAARPDEEAPVQSSIGASSPPPSDPPTELRSAPESDRPAAAPWDPMFTPPTPGSSTEGERPSTTERDVTQEPKVSAEVDVPVAKPVAAPSPTAPTAVPVGTSRATSDSSAKGSGVRDSDSTAQTTRSSPSGTDNAFPFPSGTERDASPEVHPEPVDRLDAPSESDGAFPASPNADRAETAPAGDTPPDSESSDAALPWQDALPVEAAEAALPDETSPETPDGFPDFTAIVPDAPQTRHPSGINRGVRPQSNGLLRSFMGSRKPIVAGTTVLLVLLLAWGVWAWSHADAPAEHEPGEVVSKTELPSPHTPSEVTERVPKTASPARRELHVGPESDFPSLAAALTYVADHHADYQSGRRNSRVLIRVDGGHTYRESLVIDNAEAARYPAGLEIVATGSEPAILAPSRSGPVLRLAGLTRFVLENFEIQADGHPVAVELADAMIDSRLQRLKISGFTASGIRVSGVTGLLQEEVLLKEVECHGQSAQATGIQIVGKNEQAVSRVRIEKCRFFGPLVAGVAVESDASFLEIRECIFAETEVGVRFSDSQPILREVLIGNNTFFDTGRGIVFASMPHTSSRELALLHNLFAGVDGPEALIVSDYSDAAFNRMLSTNGAAIENNWSDRPAPASPMAGERNLMLRPERERVREIRFASTDPADPAFLAPAPKSPHAVVRGTRRGLKPYVGAVGRDEK